MIIVIVAVIIMIMMMMILRVIEFVIKIMIGLYTLI